MDAGMSTDHNSVIVRSASIGGVVGSILRKGVVSIVRDRSSAAAYWRRVARAALDRSAKAADPPAPHVAAIAQKEVTALLPEASTVPISLHDYCDTDGVMPIEELLVLCRIVRLYRPDVIFEIGTYRGGTTVQLAANSRATIYTLDLPSGDGGEDVRLKHQQPDLDVYPERPGEFFHGTVYQDRINQLLGDSLSFDYAPYHKMMGMVFVDGCHHYEFVASDSRNALTMLAPGGVILWHDYAPYAPGVVQALDELSREIPLTHIAGTSLVIYQG
jgi:hypothetical protein